MARKRRQKPHPLELLAPLVGIILLGVFFVPGFKTLVISLLMLLLIGGALALAILLGWKIYKKSRNTPDPQASTSPLTNQVPLHLNRTPTSASNLDNDPILTWSVDLLRELEWKRFEDVVAAYIQELGQIARTTRIGPDGGVDVEVLDPVSQQVVMLVQCKAWDAYKVGIKPLRELFGVMAAAKISEGAFFTTGEYTQEAKQFAQEHHLDAIDGNELISRIGQLGAPSQQKLLNLATEGDYTTPTCPSCGVKMVSRIATKGSSEGKEFWGCRNYPRCKQTFRS